jgi:hypothetical protein
METDLLPGDDIEVIAQVGAHADVVGVARIVAHGMVPDLQLDPERLKDSLERSLDHSGVGLFEEVIVPSGDRRATKADHELRLVVAFAPEEQVHELCSVDLPRPGWEMKGFQEERIVPGEVSQESDTKDQETSNPTLEKFSTSRR